MKKNIFSWGLYDFANSLVTANLTLYLTQWIVVDNHVEDIWVSLTLAISTLLLILSAPLFGAYADRTGRKMALITPITIIIALATILLGIFGVSGLPLFTKIAVVVILYFIIIYLYQLSLVFYDTFLPVLTTPKKYGKISGFGEGMGNLGFLAGLFLTFPFISGKITLFGEPGRIQAFIPAGIGFLILSLPMLLSFKDKPVSNKVSSKSNFMVTLKSLKLLLKNHNIFWFLISFYFISDAVLTIQTFFPIYLQQVLGLPDSKKLLFTALVMISIIIGAMIIGRISDKVGHKKTLLFATTVLALLLASIPLTKNVNYVWLVTPAVGIFWGGFYASSRAFLTILAPAEKITEFFSLYTIFRRFASIIGPMIWGISVLIFSPLGADKYRIAIYPLVFLMFIGIFLLLKVSEVKLK